MKRFMKLFAILAALVLVPACAKIDPTSEVGILVKTTGDKALHPDSIPLERGRVFWNPITHDLHTYPITYQTVVWTGPESLTFTTMDKAPVNVDFSFTYAVVPEKVPHIYVKHRKSLPDLTQTYMKSKVRAALNAAAATRKAEDIVGSGRTEFLADVKLILNEELGDEGFVFDMVEIINSPRLPENVQRAINLALEATQNAQIAENQLRQVRAEAAKRIAEAEGAAEAQLIAAKAAAERKLIEARAEAEANRIVSQSLTEYLLREKAIEKWDGKYPQTVAGGNAVPMIRF